MDTNTEKEQADAIKTAIYLLKDEANSLQCELNEPALKTLSHRARCAIVIEIGRFKRTADILSSIRVNPCPSVVEPPKQ